MSFLRRGTLGLALATVLASGLVAGIGPASNADNLGVTDDLATITTVALGDLCRGATASRQIGFALQRRGEVNNNTWANGTDVWITGATQASGFTLGSVKATTPTNWTTIGNTDLPVGSADLSMSVPTAAPLGLAQASVTWSASGGGAQTPTVTKTSSLTVTWRVVTCAPTDTTPPVIGYVLNPATPSGTNGWYREDVAIDWTVTDSQSTATSDGCGDQTFTTDGTHLSTCAATSQGGTAGPVTATVKIDRTAPSVTPTVKGALGDNGWYTGDVTVSWKVADATSGVDTASPDCAGATLTSDTAGATYTCTVVDKAGNKTTVTREVRRDATEPVILSSVKGSEGNDGWYVGNVTVDWTVTDATSDLASTTGCDDVSVVTDTNGTTYTCTAIDNAGHHASDSVSLKRDATPPMITYNTSGTEGDNGWYRGPVVVTWGVTDAGSGVAQACAPETVSGDGVHEPECRATDVAGNMASSPALVQVDGTAPVITPDVTGPSKVAGWFNGDVSVKWDVDDPTSGIAEGPACDEVTLTEDTDGTTYTCSATDVAGNSDSKSVTVRRDATAPVVTPIVSGTHNGEWYTGDVSVTWAITEATSGVGSTSGCGQVTLDTDTRGEAYTCSVTDRAGNPASGSVTVKRDATAPVITPVVTGPRKGTEWYTGDVSVKWDVSDPTSGLADSDGCDEATVTEDTTGTTYTCSATDLAGNSDNKSVTVKRDATAPVLTLTGGPAAGATYDFGDVPAPSTCEASDVTSRLAGPCTVTAGGTTVGAKTQVATATDQAGNVTTEERKYTVAAWRLDGFYKPVTMGTSVVNTVKAGSTVPLKFNVYKGAVPMTAGIGATFAANKVTCDGSDVQDPVDFVTTGATSLRYDAAGGQWIQNWATPSGGKGSCYRVTMTTGDGSKISADFALK
ncbi:PxKF domain-containing protein [Nocardia sp. N13]|uniref:PxKF domain-containing protein n=1 Tax=Nocardioides sp. N13(2025) TaxID=3453405 RepID=UPI003F772EB7